MRAMVTERVGPGRSGCRSISPAGSRARTSMTSYPEGAAPIVRGEACNTATTYGYDSGDPDAGDQGDALPDHDRHKRRQHHGTDEISL